MSEITLNQMETITGVKYSTLQEHRKSGKLTCIKEVKGNRHFWLVASDELTRYVNNELNNSGKIYAMCFFISGLIGDVLGQDISNRIKEETNDEFQIKLEEIVKRYI